MRYFFKGGIKLGAKIFARKTENLFCVFPTEHEETEKNCEEGHLDPLSLPLSEISPEQLTEFIRSAKISTPACKEGAYTVCEAVRSFEGVRRVIIDCTLCEPYMNVNRYIAEKKLDAFVGGIKILIRACSAIGGIIIVDDSHLPTVRAIESVCDGKLIAMRICEPKYPQSNEKLLMHAAIHKECSPSKRPSDYGCAIFDGEACVAIYEACVFGKAMSNRLISLYDGKKSYVISLPKGTELKTLLNHFSPESRYFSYGAFSKLSPIKEGNTVSSHQRIIIASRKRPRAVRSFSCINCGRCDEICPMYLSPYRMLHAKGNAKKLTSLGVECCISCNCCSAICPSGIDIPASFAIKEVPVNE